MIKFLPIVGKRRFTEIYETAKKFNSNSAYAYIVPRSGIICPDDVLYFTPGISKRTAKLSVTRNRIKRLLRVSIRLIAEENTKINLSNYGYI